MISSNRVIKEGKFMSSKDFQKHKKNGKLVFH